jgi:hypothetical protein
MKAEFKYGRHGTARSYVLGNYPLKIHCAAGMLPLQKRDSDPLANGSPNVQPSVIPTCFVAAARGVSAQAYAILVRLLSISGNQPHGCSFLCLEISTRLLALQMGSVVG